MVMDSKGNWSIEGSQHSLLSSKIWQLAARYLMSEARVCASEQQTVTLISFKNKAKPPQKHTNILYRNILVT